MSQTQTEEYINERDNLCCSASAFVGEGEIVYWSQRPDPYEDEERRVVYNAQIKFASGKIIDIYNNEVSDIKGRSRDYIGEPLFKVGDKVGVYRTGSDPMDARIVVK